MVMKGYLVIGVSVKRLEIDRNQSVIAELTFVVRVFKLVTLNVINMIDRISIFICRKAGE
jgi:hypothetical protein